VRFHDVERDSSDAATWNNSSQIIQARMQSKTVCCSDETFMCYCCLSMCTCTWPLCFLGLVFGFACKDNFSEVLDGKKFKIELHYKPLPGANDALIQQFFEEQIEVTNSDRVQFLQSQGIRFPPVNTAQSTDEGGTASASSGPVPAPPPYDVASTVQVATSEPVPVVAPSSETSISSGLAAAPAAPAAAVVEPFELTFSLIRDTTVTSANLPVGDPSTQTVAGLKAAALLILGITDNSSEYSAIHKGNRLDESATIAVANVSNRDKITLLPIS